MERRTFLKMSVAAPVFLKLSSCTQQNSGFVKLTQATEKSFDVLEVKGSYREIGLAMGKYFGKRIKEIMDSRKSWVDSMLAVMATEQGRKFSDELLRITKKNLPHLIQELEGIADGSGIDFKAVWAMSIQSELGTFKMETPGCSTVYYHDQTNTWHFHNEDGDVAYKDKMFVLKAHPPSGISFCTLVYTGVIPGVGPSINSEGIIETTNFLPTLKTQPGIPRYFLGRAILEARNLADAINIATSMPRACSWHHNLISTKTEEYASVETLNTGVSDVYKHYNGIYIHTNHQIGKNTCSYLPDDFKEKIKETYTRYDVLEEEKSNAEMPITDPTTILEWLSSHKTAPDTPCRHAIGGNTGQTLATAFFDVKKGNMRIYKDNPCFAVPNGRYADYKF